MGEEHFPEVPGYDIHGVLGSGGGGVVYRATHHSLSRPVALKVFALGADPDSTALQRFVREAKILASLDHPHLVKIFDFGERDDLCYLAMELLPGGSLRRRLAEAPSRRGLGGSTTWALAMEILSALQVLHKAGLVHRDVKPDNILFDLKDRAYLADLGLIRSLSADVTQLTRTGDLVGTVPYMAPEAFESAALTASADLFSLGATLYEAASGEHPNRRLPMGPGFRAPDLQKVCPACPPALCRLVARLLETAPEKRPASAGAALALLESSQVPPAATPYARRRFHLILAIGLLVVGLMAAYSVGGRTALQPSRLPVVRLVGVTGTGPDRQLWLEAERGAGASWSAAGPRVALGSGVTGVPWPAAESVLNLRFASGETAQLRLLGPEVPVSRSALRLPDLGVSGRWSPDLVEWAVQKGIGWLRFRQGADGRALLDASVFAELSQRSPIRTLVDVPDDDAKDLRKLKHMLNSFRLATFRMPLLRREDSATLARILEISDTHIVDEHVRQQLALDRFLAHHAPPFQLINSAYVFTASPVGREALAKVAAARGCVQCVNMSLLLDRMSEWTFEVDQLNTLAAKVRAGICVEWILVSPMRLFNPVILQQERVEDKDLGVRSPVELPARIYILARAHYPKAAVILEVCNCRQVESRQEGPSWRLLERTALLLADCQYRARLDPARIKSVETPGAGATFGGMVFADREHHVEVLWNEGNPRRVVYVPRRPGVLWSAADPKQPVLEPKLVSQPQKLTVYLGACPTIYEEMRPVGATASGVQLSSSEDSMDRPNSPTLR